MPAAPLISVIIVNFNAGEWLSRSVQSVVDQTLTDFECFIVDNGSTDGSLDALPRLDERFSIIEAGKNLGFAAGNNLAAKQAHGEWIALLNPDAFARPDWLEKLLAASRLAPNVTMVGSKQFMALEPGIYDGLGDCLHVTGLAWRAGFGHAVVNKTNEAGLQSGEVFAPCAAAALYKRDAFEAAGGFDERFFCYHEDVDLGFRLRLAGGTCIQSDDAVVDHVSSGISGRASDFAVYHGTRNRMWTFVKNMPGPLLFLLLPAHIALNLALLFWAMFRKGRFAPTFRGVRHGIKGLPPIWRSRKALHAARIASSMDILSALAWSPIKVVTRGVHMIKPSK